MSTQFPLGQTVITTNAQNNLHPEDVLKSLARHAACDWGEVDAEDQQRNNDALKDGDRLMSAYTDRNGTKLWIITESDRSVTTVLLPDDY